VAPGVARARHTAQANPPLQAAPLGWSATSNSFYVEADPNLQGYQAFQNGPIKYVPGFELGF